MYKSNLYRYDSSEEQQSEEDNQISPVFFKSAVFNKNQSPLIRSGDHQNNEQGDDNQIEQQQSHLRPKLKIEPQQKLNENKEAKCMQNVSGLMRINKQSVSQANLNKKAVNAAYTFKLKSPNPSKKKHDPVSLFQKNSTSWKKDKFLTSRTDLKEGRKLQLQKRNKQYV